MTVFRQKRLQVFHLGCEQGGLRTLPLDQLLLAAYLLLQAPLLLAQFVFFFRCHSCTVVAFLSSGKSSSTPEQLLTFYRI